MNGKLPTTQEMVLRLLRADILTGLLRPGQQIIQESLASRYGVSRAPLREAMRVLEGEGQIIHSPHRGYFVTELDVENLREVYRLREILEREAILAAIPNLTDTDIEAVAALADEVCAAASSGDLLAITLANRRFHFMIFEACRMPRLIRILTQLWDSTDVYRSVYFAATGSMELVAREHAGMLDALRARDAEEVNRWQDLHRDHALVSLAEAIGGTAPSGMP
ncbi:MAG: GntR family transcriptional regulator [Candidatus Nanopelagicales bacterium]|jgi:DNA-binding GntR family transcriptional regulator